MNLIFVFILTNESDVLATFNQDTATGLCDDSY